MSAELGERPGRVVLEEGGGAVELEAVYEPDDETAARVLLMILGLPEEEIERVVADMSLDSPGEM
jgi:hypothetical protein